MVLFFNLPGVIRQRWQSGGAPGNDRWDCRAANGRRKEAINGPGRAGLGIQPERRAARGSDYQPETTSFPLEKCCFSCFTSGGELRSKIAGLTVFR